MWKNQDCFFLDGSAVSSKLGNKTEDGIALKNNIFMAEFPFFSLDQ